MKHLAIFLLVAAMAAGAAEAKPKRAAKSAKKKAAELSAAELRATAEQELQAPAAAKPVAVKPMAKAPEPVLVSTDVLKEESAEPFAASELEVGAQAYRPTGSGQVAAGETYSYAGLSAKPMVLVGGRHWFYQGLATSRPWRAGFGLQGGFTSNSMRIQTSRGYVYDDVRLNSYLASAGPEAEYFFGGRRNFGVGARIGAGRLLSSQSATNSSISQSQTAGIWEAAAHLRYQPKANFFVKLAYAHRANLGAEKNIEVQENNFEAFVGFGI